MYGHIPLYVLLFTDILDDRPTLEQAELAYILDNVESDDGDDTDLHVAILFTDDNTTTVCPASWIVSGAREEGSVVTVDWYNEHWEGTIIKMSGMLSNIETWLIIPPANKVVWGISVSKEYLLLNIRRFVWLCPPSKKEGHIALHMSVCW